MSFYLDYLSRCIGYESYNEYLLSPHWKEFSKANKKKVCYICNNRKSLQLHHITYDRLGKELPQDVVTVCDICHDKIHKLVKEKNETLSTAHNKIDKEESIRTRIYNNSIKWVFWKKLCNKDLKQQPRDIVEVLRELEYMESNSFNPTQKAISCNLAKMEDNKSKWNLDKYIAIARFHRKQKKSK